MRIYKGRLLVILFCSIFMTEYASAKTWTLKECLDYAAQNNISLKKKTYMGSNKNKGYEYDADRLYSSQKDKEKQLRLEKESRHG